MPKRDRLQPPQIHGPHSRWPSDTITPSWQPGRIGAMCHGLWIGTDTKRSLVYWSYLASAFGVLFLTFFRILAVRSQKPKKVVRLKAEAEAA